MKLNQPQARAANTTRGRILVLAGAGSGKTSVIISRIRLLIEKHDVLPENILGLTFTNKAAGEMRHRVASFIGKEKASELTLTTFHSFCFHLLKKEIHHLGYLTNFTLYDERDMQRLMQSVAKSGGEQKFPLGFQSLSDLRKASLAAASSKEEEERIGYYSGLAEELEECLKAYNAVDFDGLLELTVRLFENHPEILARYQDRYKFIMIDEYQDTNPIQYRLAKLLSSKHNNFFVVGDDDQSIYGWRGSEVKHILRFEYDELIKLEQNYRSTPTILAAANAVIAHNEERHPKVLWSNQEHGELIQIFNAPTEEEEVQSVIERILYLHNERQVPFSEIAILYRSNSLSRLFEVALMQTPRKVNGSWVRGIPYDIVQGTEFYERAEIKDLLAYLRLLMNNKDTEALLRIINYPRRGISPRTIELIKAHAKENNLSLWEAIKSLSSEKAALLQFVELIEGVEKEMEYSLAQGFDYLIKEIGYLDVIEEDTKSEKAKEARKGNVELFAKIIEEYEKSTENASLGDFLGNTALDLQKARHAERKQDRVQLLTFHSAKGLEFTACFLVALEDHIIPHEKSLFETGLEEERRLMYVAITRAKKYLTLSMARSRKRNGKPLPSNPSRFLFEIPKELLSVTPHKGPIHYF
ncbi:MAG: ATP-dependent DNA helicase [Chlamydiae bacterium]|nr:ATP-dependent DNA helicase [Chlamydiota bacterium]